jgi:hypothetical protein
MLVTGAPGDWDEIHMARVNIAPSAGDEIHMTRVNSAPSEGTLCRNMCWGGVGELRFAKMDFAPCKVNHSSCEAELKYASSGNEEHTDFCTTYFTQSNF